VGVTVGVLLGAGVDVLVAVHAEVGMAAAGCVTAAEGDGSGCWEAGCCVAAAGAASLGSPGQTPQAANIEEISKHREKKRIFFIGSDTQILTETI
jgi:hypothetical protein